MVLLKRPRQKKPVPLGFDIKTDEDHCGGPTNKILNTYQHFSHFIRNFILIACAILAILILLIGIVLSIIYFATQWKAVKDELEARCRSCTKLLIIGGSTGSIFTENLTGRVEVIDLRHNNPGKCRLNSSNSDHLPAFLFGPKGGVVDEIPIVCGIKSEGSDFELSVNESYLCYKLNTQNGWEPFSNMEVGRGFFGAAVTNHGLIAIGGFSSNLLYSKHRSMFVDNNVEILPSIKSKQWSKPDKKATKNNKKGFDQLVFFQCTVMLNSTTMMLIGGAKYTPDALSISKAINDTWFYNINKGDWKEGPPLLQPRFAHACGLIRNSGINSGFVIVAGGTTNNNLKGGTVPNSVEILKISTTAELKWRRGPSLPYNVAFGSMVETTEGVFLIGGLTNKISKTSNITASASNYIYFLNQKSGWKKLQQTLKNSSLNHASMLIPDSLVKCSY